jgi:hypothetical protein
MANQPLWLKVVHRVERKIGEPVEKVVASNTYFDVVAQAKRSASRVTGTVEGLSRRGLHLLNLPAGTDIRRVREQLARMDRRLLQLTKELDDLEVTRPERPATADDEPRHSRTR